MQFKIKISNESYFFQIGMIYLICYVGYFLWLFLIQIPKNDPINHYGDQTVKIWSCIIIALIYLIYSGFFLKFNAIYRVISGGILTFLVVILVLIYELLYTSGGGMFGTGFFSYVVIYSFLMFFYPPLLILVFLELFKKYQYFKLMYSISLLLVLGWFTFEEITRHIIYFFISFLL